MSWKDKTCEKCKYRAGDECRRFPPALRGIVIYSEYVGYPVTRINDLACAEYAEEGQTPELVHDACKGTHSGVEMLEKSAKAFVDGVAAAGLDSEW